MIKNTSLIRRFINLLLPLVIIISVSPSSSYSQEMQKMKRDTIAIKKKDTIGMQNQMMLPMPFFTHMAMPLEVGSYNVRAALLPTQIDGKTTTEFNVQFTTGLSKTVGLFLGAEGAFDAPTLEAMFQFLVWKSKNGMNAFSPIIEFEFPLAKEAKRKVYTLVGFATTISNPRIAFNQVLHYSPLEDLAEGSVSLVAKVSNRIFLVAEISGVTQKGEGPIFNLLGGVKIKLNKNFMIGIGYQHPVTSNRGFSSQYIIQPDISWKR